MYDKSTSATQLLPCHLQLYPLPCHILLYTDTGMISEVFYREIPLMMPPYPSHQHTHTTPAPAPSCRASWSPEEGPETRRARTGVTVRVILLHSTHVPSRTATKKHAHPISYRPAPPPPATMSEGLSRRRGHGSASGGAGANTTTSPSSNNGSPNPGSGTTFSMGPGSSLGPEGIRRPSSTSGSNSASAGGAGPGSSNGSSAMASSGSKSGHKIAYDPRDLETNSDEHEMPKLTLMEEVLLVGLKEWVDHASSAALRRH